jgi:hypothetical protein
MDWDGKQVTGQINPGPDSVPLTSVFVDVPNWTVRIEANPKDGVRLPHGDLLEGIPAGRLQSFPGPRVSKRSWV